MLVLSRQRDETIMIGDDVEITVVDIRGDKVRLGITAPTSIAVHRKEVYEAIRAENERAARITDADADLLGRTLATGDGAERRRPGSGIQPGARIARQDGQHNRAEEDSPRSGRRARPA